MKALVYHGQDNRSYEEKPMPVITDANGQTVQGIPCNCTYQANSKQ